MKIFTGIDEVRAAAGTHLGYSEWHTITQEQVNLFAQATGDDQWIHTDAVRAAEGPFGSTIAHGYLTLSLIPMLVRDVYRLDGIRMAVNYGTEAVRFPSPVPVGSRVRAGVEFLSVVEGSGGHRVTARVTIEREGSDKPACVATTIAVLFD